MGERLISTFDPVWTTATYGNGIGLTGIEHADLDGDGLEEVVIGSARHSGRNTIWAVQQYDRRRQRYDLRWQSLGDGDFINDVAVLRFEVTPWRIYVGRPSGTVEIYEGVRPVLVDTVTVGDEEIQQVLQGDPDNNGVADLVILTVDSTYLYDPFTLERRRRLSIGASSMVIGNMDDDAEVEIAYDTGQVITETPLGRQFQWRRKPFGSSIIGADIDGDGRIEILSHDDQTVRAFDVETKSQRWARSAGDHVMALHAADISGDGTDEVFHAVYRDDSLSMRDGATGTLVRKIGSVGWWVHGVGVLDADGDGRLELLVGGGSPTDLSAAALHVYDAATGSLEWLSVDDDPPYYGIALGDTDGDGRDELVTASATSNNQYADGLVTVYDPKRNIPLWQTTPTTFGRCVWEGIFDVALHDIDGDGAAEIFVAGDCIRDGVLHVLDGKTRTLENTYHYDDSCGLYTLAFGDLDGDGDIDLAAGAGGHCSRIYSIDPLTGAVQWQVDGPAVAWTGMYDMAVANVDADPAAEIVVSIMNLFILDTHTRQYTSITHPHYLRAFGLVDTGSGRKRIFGGTEGGELLEIDTSAATATSLGKVCDHAMLSITQLSRRRIAYSCRETLGTYDIGARVEEWESEPLNWLLGYHGSILSWRAGGSRRLAVGGYYRVTVLKETLVPASAVTPPASSP